MDFKTSELTSSIFILLVQYGLVLYIVFYMIKKPLLYLQNENTKKLTGNLYAQLDASSRLKVTFGLAFYL